MPNPFSIKIKVSHTDSYKKALENAYNVVKGDPEYENRITFAMLAIAYVEYACNTFLTDFCENNFDEPVAASLHSHFTKLSIRAKIDLIVPLATNYSMIIDSKHLIPQSLYELIGIRNKIVHKSDDFQDINDEKLDEKALISFNVNCADPNLEKLTLGKITQLCHAAIRFVDDTLEVYSRTRSLKISDFIVINPKKSA